MSILKNILAAWGTADKISLVAIGLVCGMLIASAFWCNRSTSSFTTVTTRDTTYLLSSDTVVTHDTTTIIKQVQLTPTIDGDSVRYYHYQDPFSGFALDFNTYKDGTLDLDARLLYIRDTITITKMFGLPPPQPINANVIFPLELGADAEIAASVFPQKAVSIAATGYLRYDKISIFVRPQVITTGDMYVWGGIRWKFY